MGGEIGCRKCLQRDLWGKSLLENANEELPTAVPEWSLGSEYKFSLLGPQCPPP